MEVAESTSASIEEIAASLETQTETMDKIANSSSLLAQSPRQLLPYLLPLTFVFLVIGCYVPENGAFCRYCSC